MRAARDGREALTMSGRIVVGIDGSDSGADALHWAVSQAKLTGASVEAVYVWDPGVLVSLGMPPLMDWQLLRQAAQARPREIIDEALGSDPGVRVVTRAVIGNAAEVLADRSAGAELLVVGSRGLGGLKGMLLGSVGHHCAAHAHCPVVIVHPVPVQEARKPDRRTLSGTPAV